MVSSQYSHILPFLGKGTIRAVEEMMLPAAALCKSSHNLTSEKAVPTLSQCWIPITVASQHSRQELLSRRQNNICLNCQRFTELVTQQAGVQGEMAFQSEDLPVAGTRLGREHTHTPCRGSGRGRKDTCRLSLSRAMQQNHCGCYSGARQANIKCEPEIH